MMDIWLCILKIKVVIVGHLSIRATDYTEFTVLLYQT